MQETPICSYLLLVPTAKSLVGIILAENRKLKGEVSILKQATTLSIDLRPTNNVSQISSSEDTGATFNLFPTELEALRHAISDELLKQEGWTTDSQGRIKAKSRQIFKPGFVTAIKKVLDSRAINS